jgi:flagellar protein FliS
MNQYFEQMILSASPIELVRLMYQRAIASVRDARRHLSEGRIMDRGRSINAAFLVLVELISSLNREEAPELAARLGGLYAYMQTQLLQANLKQQDAPLAEVLGLLTTLAEAWDGISDTAVKPAVAASTPSGYQAWEQAGAEETGRIALSA